MQRREDWAVQLNNFIETNRNRVFERGVFDCAVFAGLAVKAMTDEDFVQKYIGAYKSKKEGFELLKSEGMKSLVDLAEKCLGPELENIKLAGRGDIVAVKYENEVALAVVDLTGRRAVTTGKEGLFFFESKYWLKAWGV
jgi:hypothetical protein